jgi:hypothetical protein
MSIINWDLASKLKPAAHITINKSRPKAYGSIVYLNDGTSFEIELYNPTVRLFLAKIKVNGSYISQAGIIIKPGQRIFLERFIDSDKKFKFETYEVGANSPEVMQAIANNGDIVVEFYPERLKTTINTYPQTWTTTPYYQQNGLNVNSTGRMGTVNLAGSGVTTSSASSYSADVYYSNTASFGGSTVNNISMQVAGSLETGRVEAGEKSDQELVNGYGDFANHFESQSVWKIMPLSLKPVEAGEIRQYCTGCRTRIKKSSWKFCPTCGESLKD